MLRILLVEDEPLILLDVELGLQQADHTVISVCNADRAIAILRTQAVDLVLTDIECLVPWMDSSLQQPYATVGPR